MIVPLGFLVYLVRPPQDYFHLLCGYISLVNFHYLLESYIAHFHPFPYGFSVFSHMRCLYSYLCWNEIDFSRERARDF